MTFGSACRNSCLVAVVYFLYLGFQQGFDVFGWYGVGWSRGDWIIFVLLAGLFPVVLFGEWRHQRKRALAKAAEVKADSN